MDPVLIGQGLLNGVLFGGVYSLMAVGLTLFLYRTDLGRTIRAAADNTYGALVSPFLPFQPAAGLSASVTSFNIVIIGGMGSLVGAFVGGLIVALLVRPAGLFGKRTA